MASEEDLRVVEELLLACCPEKGRGNGILSVDGELTILVGRNVQKTIATAITAARAETWKEAVELAKSVECLEGFSGHWQNGHSQAKAVIIGLLEQMSKQMTENSLNIAALAEWELVCVDGGWAYYVRERRPSTQSRNKIKV